MRHGFGSQQNVRSSHDTPSWKASSLTPFLIDRSFNSPTPLRSLTVITPPPSLTVSRNMRKLSLGQDGRGPMLDVRRSAFDVRGQRQLFDIGHRTSNIERRTPNR